MQTIVDAVAAPFDDAAAERSKPAHVAAAYAVIALLVAKLL